ncbi:MAG: hypothetical protein ACOC4G_09890 [Bacillota bacterium]
MKNNEKEKNKKANKALAGKHDKFDPEENMLKMPFSSPGYHTTLEGGYVHKTRKSLNYALDILDCDLELQDRAEAVINKVLSLQDTDPESRTFGVWPWFLEEPLEEMSPPDFNWADFLGKDLVYLLMVHQDKLSDGLTADIKQAVKNASFCIKRRNVGPHYTNISIMGAYVTLKTGEIFDDEEYFNYGKERLKKAVDYTEKHGGVTEYNSPTYTVVAIKEIGRILKYVKDKEAQKMAQVLNRYAWRCLSKHYHKPTEQLSPPNSRCYRDFQNNTFYEFISKGTGRDFSFLEEESLPYRSTISCPEEFRNNFKVFLGNNFFEEEYFAGNEDKPPLSASTYMTEDYTLGSFNKCDLWNQRRPLMAKIGSFEKTSYIKFRCLHDGYDYSSSILFSSQFKNNILVGVNFVTDYGDTHISLDLVENASIKAESLVFRFELGGNIEDIKLPDKVKMGSSCKIQVDKIEIDLNLIDCRFNSETINLRVGQNEENKWVDIVLYEGKEKELDFGEMEEAFFLFGLSINGKGENKPDYTYNGIEEGLARAKMTVAGKERHIKISVKPFPYSENLTKGQLG